MQQILGHAATRRRLIGSALAATGSLALPGLVRGQVLATPPLVPMRLTPDQLVDMKCCLRPLRAAGPNLGTETVGGKLVVHNYGHGGSGWSLSWGSAEVAVGKALASLPRSIAVSWSPSWRWRGCRWQSETDAARVLGLPLGTPGLAGRHPERALQCTIMEYAKRPIDRRAAKGSGWDDIALNAPAPPG